MLKKRIFSVQGIESQEDIFGAFTKSSANQYVAQYGDTDNKNPERCIHPDFKSRQIFLSPYSAYLLDKFILLQSAHVVYCWADIYHNLVTVVDKQAITKVCMAHLKLGQQAMFK